MAEQANRICYLETVSGRVGIPYRVHRRKGMRHLRVVVDESNQVLLKVPFGISEKRAVEFLRQQGDWVWRVMQSMPKGLRLESYLHEAPHLSGLGRRFSVEIANGTPAEVWWDLDAGTWFGRFPKDDDAARREMLIEGLRAFASEVIPARVFAIAQKYDLKVNRVTVRDQRTRWGSCSAKRTISLNWRLILLPVALHDYIILHELAHLTHLNHSKRYWDLLREYDAKSEQHDREVTEISRVVMRLGRVTKVPVNEGR
jgi:hypothetical protein